MYKLVVFAIIWCFGWLPDCGWQLGQVLAQTEIGARKVQDQNHDAQWAFDKLRALAGVYRTAEEPTKAARIEYELWSKDSAVVEKWLMASGSREFTVFYMDGEELLATHYCAIGVQSTMRLKTPVENQTCEFDVIATTNLTSQASAHNSGFDYRFNVDGSIDRREVWTKNGKQTESWIGYDLF